MTAAKPTEPSEVPRYKLVVQSAPFAGREDDYNRWYQDVHLGELVALPGIRSARRYRVARELSGSPTHPYMAIYEIETDDIDAVLEGLKSTAARGELNMSDAIDTGASVAVVWEECGEEVGG